MIPWWGWLIIAVVSGMFGLALVILAIIVTAARAEIKSAKMRHELDKAMRRHPSHRPTIHNDPWSHRPPF